MYKDPFGNEYKNRHEMCEHYGINYGCYKMRLQMGWSKEEALTTPLKKIARREDITVDHLGNIYESEAEMAKAYGIDPDFLHKRLTGGMSIENALTKDKQERTEVTDHKGKKHDTFAAMCRAYGWDITTVKRRLKRGLTLKEALETKSRNHTDIKDHLGNTYKSISAMCEHYNIDRNTYKNRISLGWTLEDTLTTPLKIINNKNQKCRIGEVREMNNGLVATITEYDCNDHIRIRFEDGTERDCGYKEFCKGGVGHETLNPCGNPNGYFAGFKTKRMEGKYFSCECEKCGLKDILTPQQMIEHHHIHEE